MEIWIGINPPIWLNIHWAEKLVSKIFRPKIIFGRKKNLLRKKIGIKKIWGRKKVLSEKYLGPTKYLGREKNVEAKKICAKNLGLEKMLWLKKCLGQIFCF